MQESYGFAATPRTGFTSYVDTVVPGGTDALADQLLADNYNWAPANGLPVERDEVVTGEHWVARPHGHRPRPPPVRGRGPGPHPPS
ncbi:hypothetical protein ACQ86D_13815 [Streptomyces galilaeus]